MTPEGIAERDRAARDRLAQTGGAVCDAAVVHRRNATYGNLLALNAAWAEYNDAAAAVLLCYVPGANSGTCPGVGAKPEMLHHTEGAGICPHCTHFKGDGQVITHPYDTHRRLLEALTPSGETKAQYNGEFTFPLEYTDEEGESQVDQIMVPWTTVKEIMQAIRTRAGLAPKTGAPQ